MKPRKSQPERRKQENPKKKKTRKSQKKKKKLKKCGRGALESHYDTPLTHSDRNGWQLQPGVEDGGTPTEVVAS